MYSLPIAAHANARKRAAAHGRVQASGVRGRGRAARSCAVCSGGESHEVARVELPQPVLAVELPQRAWR